MRDNRRLAIFEPSSVIRRGLKNLLEHRGGFDVIYDGERLRPEILKNREIDTVLLNASLVAYNPLSSISQLREISSCKTMIAIVSQHLKQSLLDEFDAVIDILQSEDQIIEILQNILNREIKADSTHNQELSDREKEVLIQLAKGLTNKEIADILNISVHTVVSHRKNIVQKTSIRTVSGLTLYAYFNKLTSPGDVNP